MKTYKVILSLEVGGIVEVKAKNSKAARKLAEEKLNNDGDSAFYKVTHRDILFCNIFEH